MSKAQTVHKSEGRYASVINAALKRMLVIAVVISVVLGNPWLGNITVAKAATLNITVDYTRETVNVLPGTVLNTKYYMSTDNRKTWEMIDAGDIDIAPYLSTKPVIIYFKGNKDTQEFPLTLQAEVKNLTPVYKVLSGVGRIEFTSSYTVQYRKGTNGIWYTATSPMNTSMYETKGATLYFRTAPTAAIRAGKVVSVKIPKRPSPPSARLDAGKLCISGLKSGETQYRVGDNISWNLFNSTTPSMNYLTLYSLIGNNATANTPIPGGVIEIRTPGTAKKVDSAVKVIEIAPQVILAQSAVSVIGSTLSIIDTDMKKAYEYTVVTQGTPFDYMKAKWSSVTAKKSVVMQKVNPGDKVLVRIKSITDKVTNQIILPSTYVEAPITYLTPKK